MDMRTERLRAKPTNVTLNPVLLQEAKALKINVSRACEAGLVREISNEKMRRWNEENREAIEAWNVYIEENGMPFAEYRQF